MNLSEIQKLLRDKGIGVDIITANAEYGPGQMEINFAPSLGYSCDRPRFYLQKWS